MTTKDTPNKRTGLGKGLSSILGNAANELTTRSANAGSAVSEIRIAEIEANPFQPRTEFDETALDELAESIRLHGIIQPITVRKVAPNKYELISGERRTRAARRAGLQTIPAYVRTANDQSMLEMALIENTHREDLNAIEVALSYKRLSEECNLKQEDLAERVGKSRSAVTNYLRLLKLPEEIQIALRDNIIQVGHARPLINVPGREQQLALLEQIIDNDLNVRQVEALIKEDGAGSSKPNKTAKSTGKVAGVIAVKEWDGKFEQLTGLKTTLKPNKNGRGGQIVIRYSSQEDLEKLKSSLESQSPQQE